MKKTRISLFTTLALAVLMVGCSGLDKMKKTAPGVKYKVTPEVLEAHAGKVDVEVTVQIPEKYFDKKVILEATPVLVYEGGETAFPSYKLQGEAVDGNEKTISYTNGGSFTYTNSVPYNDKMRVSDLVVRIKATKGSSTADFDDYKIADGVLSTSTLVVNDGAEVAVGADQFKRVVSEQKMADIFFLIQQASIRGTELKKEEVVALQQFITDAQVAENKKFKGVQISAYASPDGATDLNTGLASKREKVAQDYLTRELKKSKVTGSDAEGFFNVKSTPEDWEGFKALMEKSTIQDKELILRVLSMYSDPEVREREIKNMSETFKVIATDVLPQLRRSKLTVNVDVVGKTDEAIKDLSKSDPSKLNMEELLYSATLTTDADEKLAIYNAAVVKDPQDWRAINNVGCALYAKKDLAGAKAAFTKANGLKAGVSQVNNNLGVIAINEGDLAKAEEFFGAAAGAGAELDNNLGIISIYKGDYEAAVRYFGNSTTCNAALAKILAKKYDAALSTLNANTKEAGLKYYLKAIAAARSGENDLMFESLRKSVSLDAKYKKMALTDMEFAKFIEDATFKAAIQ